MYCTHHPCVICAKMIVNSGIKRVVYLIDYPDEFAARILAEGEVSVERFEPRAC
jgi:dCMP deaminase